MSVCVCTHMCKVYTLCTQLQCPGQLQPPEYNAQSETAQVYFTIKMSIKKINPPSDLTVRMMPSVRQSNPVAAP